MNREIIFGDKARSEMLSGVNILANAVKVTMGPKGQNVVIEKPGCPPHLTKDGVTVAEAVNLRDRFPNLGAQMIKEAASRTAEVAGDGTTTATVLSQAIYSEGLKMIAAGYAPSEIKRGIIWASKNIISGLKNLSSPVTSDEEVIQVGTISSNGDEKIGSLLCEAMRRVGRHGVITVEEAKGFDTTLDVVEGTEIDRGYLSPYFVTDQSKMCAVLENPYVILINRKVASLKELLPILEVVHSEQRSLLVIADDIEGEALHALVLNKAKGTLNLCAIRAPEFGESRVNSFSDLAMLLGTEVLTETNLDEIKSDIPKFLGSCRRAVIKKTSTVLVDCSGSPEEIQNRTQEVHSLLDDPTVCGPDRDAASRRLSRLAGGVAVLRVGGATEVELRERRDRVEDALHATQAAIEEGILPGGGVALVRVAKSLKTPQGVSEGFSVGVQIIQRACSAPLKQIVENCGGTPDVVLEKVERLLKKTKGFNAASGEMVDMITAGIIDPLKVVRSAVENASSAACSLLSVGCAMTRDPRDDSSEESII